MRVYWFERQPKLAILILSCCHFWCANSVEIGARPRSVNSPKFRARMRNRPSDGVARRPLQRGTLIRVLAISAGSRGVSPASAGCTFANASTHTDACHSMFLSVITLLLSMWFRGRHWSVPVLALGFCSHPCCAAMIVSTTEDLGFELSWAQPFAGA